MAADLEPPLLNPAPQRPDAAGRVAVGLILFGMVELASDIATTIAALKDAWSDAGGNVHLSLPLACLAYWFAAWLVWTDKRVIWPIMANLAAGGLGCLFGSGLACLFLLPLKLIRVYAANETGWFGFYAVYFGLTAGFLAWVLIEASRVEWRPAMTPLRNRWLRPGSLAAYVAGLSLIVTCGVLALLTGDWTKPVVARARQQLGDGYDYQVINFNVNTVNGHTTCHAVVLAYSETDLNRITLNWKD